MSPIVIHFTVKSTVNTKEWRVNPTFYFCIENSKMDFSWAATYPEIHKICTLFNLKELSNPLKYSYTPLESFIQEGPQCGLVALAMYLGNPTKTTVENLLDRAQKDHYTNNGEMFSAEYMSRLACSFLNCSPKTGGFVELFSGALDCDYIKTCLLNKCCILVPYDTDKNNSPCLQNGCKAHWCILCGGVETDQGFFVLARHGKARNVAVWKLGDLSESNSQLNEVGVYVKDPGIVFNVPEGGVQGPLGLKKKCVILRPPAML